MGTLTISSPGHAAGSYTQNVGRAARALLDAILAIRPRSAEVAEPAIVRTAQEVRARARENMSLYRLYTMSAPYDSVMPNLAQELQVMASRDDGDNDR